MSARIGGLIALFFALVWLWLGLSVLSGAAKIAVGAACVAAVLFAGWRGWHRPMTGRRFERNWYYIAVAGELAAMFVASYFLGRYGLTAYVWPVIGIIVGLHFIGFWRAAGGSRFLWLAGGMTAINLVALAFPVGPEMLAVSAFGSFAALALAVGV